MKICAIICEFNPFHNGHKYLLNTARKLSGCDAVMCIMSGSFTQRGEICILDKYSRARHAILGGADCVIQLPAAFAVAPAEIFAKGAIKILSSIPEVTALAFGCESGDVPDFVNAAKALNNESPAFRKVLTENLDRGESYIRSYAAAFSACGGDGNILQNPNNLLGVEYTKAIIKANSNIKILPVTRVGARYKDSEIKENFSSASAIRNNLSSPLIKSNLPEFVFTDLKNVKDQTHEVNSAMRHSLFFKDAEVIKDIYGCGEGLENRLKNLANMPLKEIVNTATTRRYSSARIRRILCANMLGLYQSDTERFLNENLYIKTLAAKKQCADKILSSLSLSCYPVITGPQNHLSGTACECLEKDKFEYEIFNFLNHTENKDYMILV